MIIEKWVSSVWYASSACASDSQKMLLRLDGFYNSL